MEAGADAYPKALVPAGADAMGAPLGLGNMPAPVVHPG
jgi:hypothetical protein